MYTWLGSYEMNLVEENNTINAIAEVFISVGNFRDHTAFVLDFFFK